jgi:phosphate transport system substrate-binding protein
MNRRTFLLSALAAGSVGRSTEAGPVLPVSLEPEICRAPVRMVAAAGDDKLVYEGTHILAYGALRQIAKVYRGPLPLVVRGGGCDNAVMGVRQGGAHLGGMCCPPRGPRLDGLSSLVVAADIKAVVAHPALDIDDLATESLRAIADGGIDDWKAVGAAPGPIALVVREHCWDYAEPVRTLLLPERPTWSPRALLVTSDQNVVDAVARFPRAIGVASWVFAKPLVEAGRLKLLSVDGVLPSIDSVQLGSYALAAALSLIYAEWRPAMTPFFDFLYSPQGRAIIADRLVPVSAKDAGYQPG